MCLARQVIFRDGEGIEMLEGSVLIIPHRDLNKAQGMVMTLMVIITEGFNFLECFPGFSRETEVIGCVCVCV